ncbi:MAG: exo-alpha-sialidase [Candidatus Hydrogenedentes bacterium]|nr:exo-alpha-sialidase [Candidatus Hydrogenedentota bacterium]
MGIIVLTCASALLIAAAGQPLYEAEFVFDPKASDHGHVHASCVVECPNGDLRAVWYENGPALPDSYYSKDRDKSDNVRLGGARKPAGAGAWETPFVMSDTFGVSDNNPCMVVDKEQRLWLVYPTLMGVPQWTWGSGLVRYRISTDYANAGPPVWTVSDILIPHVSLKEATGKLIDAAAISEGWTEERKTEFKARVDGMFENPLIERLGWMPRAHPLVRSDGAVILPLSNENFGIACMAITQDGGQTWTFSKPVEGASLTQPTLAEFDDKTIVAFFRNGGKERRIKRSESTDGGLTWGPVTVTDRPHPGSGIEAIVLANGHLLLVYNDIEEGSRDQLAVSISEDRGQTWRWTRHLENTPDQRFDYPSIVQAKDGTLHATYSYNLETIKHVHFNEEWVMQGD